MKPSPKKHLEPQIKKTKKSNTLSGEVNNQIYFRGEKELCDKKFRKIGTDIKISGLSALKAFGLPLLNSNYIENKGSYDFTETTTYIILKCTVCKKFCIWFKYTDLIAKSEIIFARNINLMHLMDLHVIAKVLPLGTTSTL